MKIQVRDESKTCYGVIAINSNGHVDIGGFDWNYKIVGKNLVLTETE